MIFEPLRRSLARLFGPRATSVSPQISEDAIIDRMVDRGLIEPIGATLIRQMRQMPPSIERPGIKPPPDPATDAGWTWSAWQRELAAGAMPGWSVCRFANRIGADQAGFVFGIVRGPFGIWRQPFEVCHERDGQSLQILTCLTHLRSGLGVGIFADREVAVAAAELAELVCPAWETLDPDNRAAWDIVHNRTIDAWRGIGVRYAIDAHCHDKAGGTYGILGRSPESVMEGRPEKLS